MTPEDRQTPPKKEPILLNWILVFAVLGGVLAAAMVFTDM